MKIFMPELETSSSPLAWYKKLLSRDFFKTPSRYGIVAAFCLLLHNIIMISSDALGLSMFPAALSSFAALAVIGYLLLSHCVFLSQRSWKGFWRYTGVMAASFPLSFLLLWIFSDLAHRPMFIASPLASGSMALINFCTSRWAITFWPWGRVSTTRNCT